MTDAERIARLEKMVCVLLRFMVVHERAPEVQFTQGLSEEEQVLLNELYESIT